MVALTTEQWIYNAKQIHSETFDYSKTKYISARIKVCIICKKHGEFYQSPFDHINGKYSCPLCYDENKNRHNFKIGDKFEKLTIVEWNKNKQAWKCRCDCGGFTFVKANRLLNHIQQGCKCSMGRQSSNKKFTKYNLLPNTKFNSLTTISYDKNKRSWLCRCDCGEMCYVMSCKLVKNLVKSCGCYKTQYNVYNKLPNNLGLKRTVYRTYIKSAKDRGLDFNLSFDFFLKLISDNCKYCGNVPSNIKKHGKQILVYNGIDRFDINSIQYDEHILVEGIFDTLSDLLKQGYEKVKDKIEKIINYLIGLLDKGIQYFLDILGISINVDMQNEIEF